MSKYQEVMDHIKVDDEMKKCILQNVEKQLEEAPKEVDIPKSKVVPFRRYAAIAATFAVLLLGSYAVSQVTGGITNTSSSTSLYEPAMDAASEAPAMEAAEAPAMEEAASEAPAMEEAAEAPVMENEAETEAEPTYSNKDEAPVKAEDSAQVNAPEQTEALEPPAAPVVSAEDELPILGSGRPIGAEVVTVLIAAFVLTAIIIFVIKRKR
ncbi:hypothetical protein [Butyrivibrio sp. FCS006]|uniref:hypothetical protein n=1 Tax=Butyrivibrio sp. FCS006 TaxID=1280684 RepID=UPI000417F3E5|nr:hypothetical protein [Butyrivibrio sp. FCS006]